MIWGPPTRQALSEEGGHVQEDCTDTGPKGEGDGCQDKHDILHCTIGRPTLSCKISNFIWSETKHTKVFSRIRLSHCPPPPFPQTGCVPSRVDHAGHLPDVLQKPQARLLKLDAGGSAPWSPVCLGVLLRRRMPAFRA